MTEKILEIFGVFAIAIFTAFGAIKFLAKRIFESYLTKSIETHKSDLERITISHQIQFASLHKERAEVIRELYHRLHDYKMVIIKFFNMPLAEGREDLDLKHRMEAWSNVVPNFSDYFHRNRIYFSSSLCEIIDRLNNELDKINHDTRKFLTSFDTIDAQIEAIKSNDPHFVSLKENTNDFLEKHIMVISEDLEKEFRKILGVT